MEAMVVRTMQSQLSLNMFNRWQCTDRTWRCPSSWSAAVLTSSSSWMISGTGGTTWWAKSTCGKLYPNTTHVYLIIILQYCVHNIPSPATFCACILINRTHCRIIERTSHSISSSPLVDEYWTALEAFYISVIDVTHIIDLFSLQIYT